jgi:hypothetical protein
MNRRPIALKSVFFPDFPFRKWLRIMFFAPQRIPFLFLSIIIHAFPLRAANSCNKQMRSVQAIWQSIVEVEVIVRSVELIAGVDI